MKNFDSFIGIDWSGAKAVYTNAIAIAQCDIGQDAPFLVQNPVGKKLWSRHDVFQYLCFLAGQKKRILIGVDANFGYFYKVGTRHFGKNYTAKKHWREIDKACEGTANFYAEGFWQDAKYKGDFWVKGTQPKWFEARELRRQTEQVAIDEGLGNPESPFKFIGSKQVGKGGLAVQRMAHHLSKNLGDKIAFWPFDEQDKIDKAALVICEIYPRLFIRLAQLGNKKITVLNSKNLNLAYKVFKTKPPMRNFYFSDHDTDALVSSAGLRYLCGSNKKIPNMLAKPTIMNDDAKYREGWIFGVGAQL